ncbi:MAG: hypothetical protein ABII64_01995 [Elusimicrobiota bacterium]
MKNYVLQNVLLAGNTFPDTPHFIFSLILKAVSPTSLEGFPLILAETPLTPHPQ